MDQPSEIIRQAARPAGAECPDSPRSGGVSWVAKIILLGWLAGIMAISFLIYSGTLLEKLGLQSPFMKTIEDKLSVFFS